MLLSFCGKNFQFVVTIHQSFPEPTITWLSPEAVDRRKTDISYPVRDLLRGSGLLQILFHCVDEILVDEEDEPEAGYLKEIAKSTVKINSNQIETNNFFITFNIQ